MWKAYGWNTTTERNTKIDVIRKFVPIRSKRDREREALGLLFNIQLRRREGRRRRRKKNNVVLLLFFDVFLPSSRLDVPLRWETFPYSPPPLPSALPLLLLSPLLWQLRISRRWIAMAVAVNSTYCLDVFNQFNQRHSTRSWLTGP